MQMENSVHVALDWSLIDWLPDETWQKDTLPKLIENGVNPNNINRSVYVIRLNGNYTIQYPHGESPTVYVGEGNFFSRINCHKKWISEIRDPVNNFSFQVCIATPRVRKNEYAYIDCEAALLARFGEKFRSAPLWNKQFETRRCPHYVYSQRQLDYVLCMRSGSKYKWALKPMPSSPFFESWRKTHF
jgi:hypothetical protein